MSSIDKKLIDEWDVIDTIFRDTEYYKSQHQVESFDEFIFSEENGIRNIIKRENPFILYKGQDATTNTFSYEIRIYYGETLNEEGEIIPNIENIYVSSPAIYEGDKMSEMFPNEARLRNLTYKTNIFCNIGIHYIFHDKGPQGEIIPSKVLNLKKVNIGSIPIMVHSKLCILHGLDSIKLKEFGECPFDQGGYFIINGKEKVMLSLEKKVNNILYINGSSEDNIILQGNIKSVSNEGFQSSRTNVISYVKNTIRTQIESTVVTRVENTFNIRILGIDIQIPVFILFRALGFESDRRILSLIIYDNDTTVLKDKLIELLRPTIKASQPVYTQKSAFKLLSLNTKGKENFNVIDILLNNLFPNYGGDNTSKAYYLGYIIRKMLLTHIKFLQETDRDSYVNKRIDLPGSLLLELYRELWGKFKRNTSLKIDHEYKLNYESIPESNISNLINNSNIGKIFDNSIMDSVNRSFGARFGTGISAREGIVQTLNRNVMLGTLSHIRRLSIPLPSGSKVDGPRKLHNSQWGFVCPTESPDGGNVGIINHLSIIARVTNNIKEDGVYESLIDGEIMVLNNISVQDLSKYTNVFLNGRLIGIHRSPKLLLKYMKLLKLNSFINITTSISWNIQTDEFHVFTDSGRIIRPVFRLKTDSNGNKYNELISGNYEYIKTWNRAIHGYLFNKIDDINFSTPTYFREELSILKKNKDYLEILEKESSVIEYIDPIESENILIAKDIRTFENIHSHCDIHHSLMLSAVSLNIPFPEHSQYPRNVFSCQQTKQAVGVYSSSYPSRFETFSHILNYPQRPIVTTRFKKYTDVDKLPYGINAIVAIASYSGYNQEDAIILNKSSVDRGMFRSLYYRSYEDKEENENGKKEYFGNPMKEKNVQKLSAGNFDKLDDNGFIKEGTSITDDDILSSKCILSSNSNGNEITKIKGKRAGFGISGIVDKVSIMKNKEGLRSCKIRIRKEKVPGVGDKFSSRCGQKGMCGMVLPAWEMPFTKEGIVPDIIINPHAIPSRMTINQLLEVILGKSSCLGGFLGDATPFQNNDITEFSKVLEGFNYQKNGNEVMYSGINGEQLKSSIFIGPTYYQRLKIMVADKMHSRGKGPSQYLTKQPAAGRANNGGLRIGEMERDSIISHGISNFLNESVMERSDKYKVQIDNKTGLISYNDINAEDKKSINLPYSMKLLLQELETMAIGARLITKSNVNPIILNELNKNISNNSIIDDNLGEEENTEEETN
ncbi:hypothetical protein CMK20_18965 [Candidatus Poribacteria bacterium]|nr:hypothetical protein [Candidatus Poribacteria bacterium]